MTISKVHDEHEARKLGFFEDEDEEDEEHELTREEWLEKYGAREE